MIWLWLLALIVTGNFERQFPPQFYCKKKKSENWLLTSVSIKFIFSTPSNKNYKKKTIPKAYNYTLHGVEVKLQLLIPAKKGIYRFRIQYCSAVLLHSFLAVAAHQCHDCQSCSHLFVPHFVDFVLRVLVLVQVWLQRLAHQILASQ